MGGDEKRLRSKTPGIGGTIKNKAEDFLVEEITNEGEILQLDTVNWKPKTTSIQPSKFVHFILQKRDWSTSYAIKEIAKKLHTSPKRFSYAGQKDKTAITTQLVSAQGIEIGIGLAYIKIDITDRLAALVAAFECGVSGASVNRYGRFINIIHDYRQIDDVFRGRRP